MAGFRRMLVAGGRPCSVFKVWRASYTTTPYNSENLSVTLRNGYPLLSVPLPSKRESCDFTFRPYLHNISDFIKHIREEDMGVESIGVYSTEGNRLAGSTGIDILLQKEFDLKINDIKHRVEIPPEARYDPAEDPGLGDVRNMVHKLFSSLNVEKHQLMRHNELRGELEQLQSDIAPLEVEKEKLEMSSLTHSNVWMWGGMAFMSLQFGFFARLTWWEYSWDIMEPVTYFVTYGTSMAMFAYFVLTRQEYVYLDAKGRVQLKQFHKIAQKKNFDIGRYNHLKEAIDKVEQKLHRLHDPLQLNLPTPPPEGKDQS